jgi:hypothetical protein
MDHPCRPPAPSIRKITDWFARKMNAVFGEPLLLQREFAPRLAPARNGLDIIRDPRFGSRHVAAAKPRSISIF